MKFLHKIALILGGGKRWVIGSVTVYLWPFVAMAIFVALLVAYDYFLA